MERIGHLPVAIDEVEHLVEQHQRGRARRGEHTSERLGARWGRRCARAEQLDTALTGELTGDVDPWRLSSLPRIPRVADEDRHPGLGSGGQPRVVQEIRDPFQAVHGLACRHEVIQRGQCVGLAPAELRHQRHHRRRIRRLPRQTPRHHSCVLAQCAREAG
ncbi:MAG: hypothetical protein F4Z60_11810, partial [Chloroflexi bacterium]|nr:hypothetical protein [Chloroflexota bacterium]